MDRSEHDTILTVQIAVLRGLLSPAEADRFAELPAGALVEERRLTPSQLELVADLARRFDADRNKLVQLLQAREISPHVAQRALQILHKSLGSEPVALEAALERARVSPLPTRLFDRYEVLDEIGRGGMGVVYLVRDALLNRVVALKIVPRGDDTRETRFLREARLQAGLTHPHIMGILDFGQDKDSHYFTMPYLEGETLHEARSVPQPDIRVLVRHVADIADALAYAHTHGVTHRDVKPSNVLIDSKGKAYIADFGLAHAGAGFTQLTLTGTVLGTPAYMAPEQAKPSKENPPDKRADVYGLGATLYYCLTGSDPFTGQSALEVLDAVRSQLAVPPRRLDVRIPVPLELICLKAMEKDRERRYPTMNEFALDLRRYLSGEPISARRVSTTYRVRRLVRRNPWAWALGATAAGLAVAAASLAAWFSVLELRQERLAELQQSKDGAQIALERWQAQRYMPAHDVGPWKRELRLAAERMRTTLASAPLDPSAWSTLGWSLFELGHLGPAQRAMEAAVRLDPEDGLHAYRLGRVYMAVCEREIARVAIEGAPGTAEETRRRGEEQLARAVSLPRWSADREWEREYARAYMLWAGGRQEDALRLCKRAANGHAEGGEEFLLLLGSLVESLPQKIAYCDEAIDHAPSFSRAYLAGAHCRTLLAMEKERRGLDPIEDFDSAVACAETAARIDAESAEAHAGVGDARLRWGTCLSCHALDRIPQLEASVASLSETIRLDPIHVRAYLGRARASMAWASQLETAAQDPTALLEAAAQDYGRVAALGREIFEARHGRGAARLRLAMRAQARGEDPRAPAADAITDLTEAIQETPLSAQAHADRGAAYLLRSNAPAAVEDLRRATELDPENAGAWVSLGLAWMERSDPAAAQEAFTRALAVDPDSLQALWSRGAARLSSGDTPGAAEDLARALAAWPEITPGLRGTLERAGGGSRVDGSP